MPSRALLHYEAPAERWTDALPLGNGRLGAMCFAGTAVDRFQLNEDSAWSGSPRSLTGSRDPEVDGPELVRDVRAAIAAGDTVGAEQLLRRLQYGHSQSYQPVADLWIDELDTVAGAGYQRWLDLRDAVAGHRWADERLDQEAFVSHPAQVLVVRRRSTGRPMDLRVRLDAPHPDAQAAADGTTLRMVERLPSEVAPPHEPAQTPVVYDPRPGTSGTVLTAVRVLTDGAVRPEDDTLHVRAATEVMLLVACVTDIDADLGPHGQVRVLEAAATAALDAAAARGFDELRSEHVQDHRSLYDRVNLQLPEPTDAAALPTDARARRNAELGDDPGLAALVFAFGRYLMIAGSRPGTHPLNLQGIWSHRRRPVWSSNFTTNINVEMNYWLAGPGNLAECAEPLHEWIQRLARNGETVAQNTYDADGWVAHHNSDLWGFALPAGDGDGDPCWAAWPMGGVWLSLHLWERWAFSGDRAGLERAWPVLRGAAQFCLSWMVTLPDGSLGTCPSTSPENRFLLADGTPAAVSTSTTADITLVRELFGRCLEAMAVLGARDDGLAGRLRDALERLPQIRIAPDGRVAEWSFDAIDAEPTHRHQSHLIGVHPGALVDVDQRPDLAAAARATLAARGPRSTGWSLAWRLCLHARLRDEDQAAASIAAFLAPMADDTAEEPSMTAPSGIYRNLFCAHPPFQIDGNLGFAAGVVELLLQSHHGETHLLPCLPAAWDHGSVRGLRARPGLTVDLVWSDHTLEAVRLVADTAGRTTVRYGDRRVTVWLEAGAPVQLDADLAVEDVSAFPDAADAVVQPR